MMDTLDQKLLNELQSQGFQKSPILASRLGIGERTIRRRISAMINKGLIKVVAVPNPVLLGYKGWAKIGISVASGASSSIARKLVGHSPIYFVANSIGKFDFIIAVHFDSIEKLAHFVNSELSKVKGVIRTETHILISPRKYYNFSWPAPVVKKGAYREDYPGADLSNIYKVDDIDLEILDILMQDGLTRPAVIKSKLGMVEGTIRNHLKEMAKHEVFKLEVVPNPKALEYEVWATIGIVVADRTAHEVAEEIAVNPAVYLASVSLGNFNVIIAARFHSIDLLTQFIKVELARVHGIASVVTFLHTKPLKYHGINWLLPEVTSSEKAIDADSGEIGHLSAPNRPLVR